MHKHLNATANSILAQNQPSYDELMAQSQRVPKTAPRLEAAIKGIYGCIEDLDAICAVAEDASERLLGPAVDNANMPGSPVGSAPNAAGLLNELESLPGYIRGRLGQLRSTLTRIGAVI